MIAKIKWNQFFINNQILIAQMIMRQTLHKSLTADRPLHVSIVNEVPQNSTRQSSQYITEQKGNDFLFKMNDQQQRYFKSLIVNGSGFNYEEDLKKEQIISESRLEYFKAIQKTLLFQNQNLKSHNNFLMGQIRLMFGKQKLNKKEFGMIQYENKVLQRKIQQIQIRLGQFQYEITKLTQKMQLMSKSTFEMPKYNNFQITQQEPQECATISQSIINVRRFFSKTEKSRQFINSSYNLQCLQQNPQKSIPKKPSQKQTQQLYCSPRANKQINKLQNLLNNIEEKIANLSHRVEQEVKQPPASPSFRRKKTIQ